MPSHPSVCNRLTTSTFCNKWSMTPTDNGLLHCTTLIPSSSTILIPLHSNLPPPHWLGARKSGDWLHRRDCLSVLNSRAQCHSGYQQGATAGKVLFSPGKEHAQSLWGDITRAVWLACGSCEMMEHAHCGQHFQRIELPNSSKALLVWTENVQSLKTWRNLGIFSYAWQMTHPWNKGQLPAKFQTPAPKHQDIRASQWNGCKCLY